MPLQQLRIIAAIAGVLWAPAVLSAPPPQVYRDEHVAIYAAIEEAGEKAVHIGDALTLRTEVVFDPSEVQVEELDADYFQRVFSELGAAVLHRPQETTTTRDSTGAIRLSASWQFLLLACPQELTSCPGHKRYEIPLISLAYRVSGENAAATSSRSARFTPWPGSIAVVPSINFEPQPNAGLHNHIPGGAYPGPRYVERTHLAGPLLLAGGVMLIFWLWLLRKGRHRPAAGHPRQISASRWQRASNALGDQTIDDEEWSDLLRRSVTWFSLDELGINPCEFLGSGYAAQGTDTWRTEECAALFRDALSQARIEPARRGEFLARLSKLTGQSLPKNGEDASR